MFFTYFKSHTVSYSVASATLSFNLTYNRCAVGGVIRFSPPPSLFYPLLFMKLRPEASGLVLARLARADFFKPYNDSLGSRFGRATYPKYILS